MVQKKVSQRENVYKMALTALFVTLTAVGAFIRIPTATVAFTLQILFVFLAGMLLGPGWGALSQLIYVLMGLVGVPVFSGGGGPAYVFQPSFGFLLGYIGGAALCGWIARRGKPTLPRLILACLAGLSVIYVIGLPYMAWILNVHLGRGLNTATILVNGMLVFLPWDGIKLLAAALLTRTILPVISRLSH